MWGGGVVKVVSLRHIRVPFSFFNSLKFNNSFKNLIMGILSEELW